MSPVDANSHYCAVCTFLSTFSCISLLLLHLAVRRTVTLVVTVPAHLGVCAVVLLLPAPSGFLLPVTQVIQPRHRWNQSAWAWLLCYHPSFPVDGCAGCCALQVFFASKVRCCQRCSTSCCREAFDLELGLARCLQASLVRVQPSPIPLNLRCCSLQELERSVSPIAHHRTYISRGSEWSNSLCTCSVVLEGLETLQQDFDLSLLCHGLAVICASQHRNASCAAVRHSSVPVCICIRRHMRSCFSILATLRFPPTQTMRKIFTASCQRGSIEPGMGDLFVSMD